MVLMRKFEAVIFDLDGTLVSSNHDYREMARRVEAILRDEGVPESELNEPRRVWEVIRAGRDGLEGLGMSVERISPTLCLINEALNEVELLSLDLVEPNPGVHEAFRLIKERGLKVGIATRAGSPYAQRSLEIAGLAGYVDTLLARDEVEDPKPDPRHLFQVAIALDAERDRVLYVGDTMTDLTTAREAGVTFVGFARNEEGIKRMKEAGCTHFISDIREIIEFVDGIIDPKPKPGS
jgi:AHBA synthesis associated protein